LRDKQIFTTTQKKIIEVLSDGLPHTKEELHTCLYADDGDLDNIKPHLTALRKILRRKGEDIVCIWKGKFERGYMHVRLIAI
jgi:predicted Zn-ribbon and HTH transcriptional regulator